MNVKDYWKIQIELIQSLQGLGFSYTIQQRLPAFKIFIRLNQLKEEGRFPNYLIEDAQKRMSALVHMRTLGIEPPHVGDKYT